MYLHTKAVSSLAHRSKTLQYLMGHSDIGVTMNTYTHLGLDDAKEEMISLEELEQARKEIREN